MKKNYSAYDRLLHWALAFTFLFIMLTVFLRLTWMEKNNVAEIIVDSLAAIHIDLSYDHAIRVAKDIRRPMFDWHIIAGYVAVVFFILRMVFHIFNRGNFNPKTIKEVFQSWSYRIFYIFLGITLITGMFIKFGPESIESEAETVHKLTLYYAIAFLILHFSGILLAEMSNKKGIVSKMIGGGKD
jgi:cytochrome b561